MTLPEKLAVYAAAVIAVFALAKFGCGAREIDESSTSGTAFVTGDETPNGPTTYVMTNMAQVEVPHPEKLTVSLKRYGRMAPFAPYTVLCISGPEGDTVLTDKGCGNGELMVGEELQNSYCFEVSANGRVVAKPGKEFSLDFLKEAVSTPGNMPDAAQDGR